MLPEPKSNVFQIQIPLPSSVLPSSISLFLNSTSLLPKPYPKEKTPSLERTQINHSIPTITNRTPLRDVKSSSLLQIINKPSMESLIEARLDNSSRRLDNSIVLKPDALKIRRIIANKQDQVDSHPKHKLASFAKPQGKEKMEGQAISASTVSEEQKCNEQNKSKREKQHYSSRLLGQGDKSLQFEKDPMLPRIQQESLSPSPPRAIRSQTKILSQESHQISLSQGNQPTNPCQDILIQENYDFPKPNIQPIPPSYPSIPTIQSKYQLISLNSPAQKSTSTNSAPAKPRFDQFENSTNFFAQIRNSCLNEFRLFNSDRTTPLRLNQPIRKESSIGYVNSKDKTPTRSISNTVLQSINSDSFGQPARKTRIVQFSMKIAGEKQVIQSRKGYDKAPAVPQKQQQEKNYEVAVQNLIQQRERYPPPIRAATNEKPESWRLRSSSFQSPKERQLSQVLGGTRTIPLKKDRKQPEMTSCSTQTQVSQPQSKTHLTGLSSHVYIDDFDICQYVKEMTPPHHHA